MLDHLRWHALVAKCALSAVLSGWMQLWKASKFAGASGCSSACVYGGQPKREQLPAVRAGAPILVATPGRLNDFLEYKARAIRAQQKIHVSAQVRTSIYPGWGISSSTRLPQRVRSEVWSLSAPCRPTEC